MEGGRTNAYHFHERQYSRYRACFGVQRRNSRVASSRHRTCFGVQRRNSYIACSSQTAALRILRRVSIFMYVLRSGGTYCGHERAARNSQARQTSSQGALKKRRTLVRGVSSGSASQDRWMDGFTGATGARGGSRRDAADGCASCSSRCSRGRREKARRIRRRPGWRSDG